MKCPNTHRGLFIKVFTPDSHSFLLDIFLIGFNWNNVRILGESYVKTCINRPKNAMYIEITPNQTH